MRSTMLRASGLALALAMAFPIAAFATTATSTVPESLAVTAAASISITGLPASLTFPAAVAGNTSTAPNMNVTVTVASASTWTLSLANSDLTSGPNTIAASNIEATINGAGAIALPGTVMDSSGVGGGVSSGGTAGVQLFVNIPPSAAGGTYTGTATFTGTAS